MIQYGLRHDYSQPKPAKELACPIAQTTKEKVRNANIIGFNDQLAPKKSE
jgi:hypothetical protein